MFIKKLFLLLWKNWLIRWRHPVLFFVEIIAVALFFGILLLVKIQLSNASGAGGVFESDTEIFDVFEERSLLSSYRFPSSESKILMYAPDTSETVRDIMAAFENLTYFSASSEHLDIQGFASEAEMLRQIDSLGLLVGFQALKGSIVFTETEGNVFSYKVRLKEFGVPTEFLFSPVSLPGAGDPYSYEWTMSPLQILIDASITRTLCKKSSSELCAQNLDEPDPVFSKAPVFHPFKVELQAFPYPAYNASLQDFLAFLFGLMLPLFTVFAFLFLMPIIHLGVVKEKQSGVKELMKMMGMSRLLYWSSWMLSCVVSLIIPITIAIIVCIAPLSSDGAIYKQSDGLIVALFYILYALSFITFAFFVTTFFDRLLKTIPIGIMMMLLTYIAPTFALNLWNVTDGMDGSVGNSEALALCLLPNMAMVYGVRVALAFEGRGVGIQWKVMNQAPYLSDGITMTSVFLMLIFDIVFYMVLTVYMDTVRPGKYGVPAPIYFPFKWSYWFPKKTKVAGSWGTAVSGIIAGKNQFFEDDPQHLNPGIEIINLRKVFRSLEGKKVAVDGVSLKVYKSQITALLGHNGAGKTTTMSILTGLYSPTEGTAIIDGYDITTSLDKVREKMGLCPQHSMLFPEITVMEHLLIFGQLKGYTKPQAEAEGKELLLRLNLLEKKDTMSASLSGGQKRKLSLAIALIGGSETVILDEPTSGMDPEARRNMWDYLQEQKGKRTILLTTHFMEEADVLGDRIAIMAEGKLQCCGSPMYLKKQYGTGVTLSMLKQEREDWRMVKSIIGQHMPTASQKSESGNELAVCLPQDQRNLYPGLLNALESRRDQLGILSFSIASTTMEEVFLKVGEGAHSEEELAGSGNGKTYGTQNSFRSNPLKPESLESLAPNTETYRNDGMGLFVQRMRAVVIKKILYLSRKYSLILSQIVLPALCCLAALLIDDATNNRASNPYALGMSKTTYEPSNAFVHTDASFPLCSQGSDAYEGFFAPPDPDHSITRVPTDKTMQDFLLERGVSDLTRYRTEDIMAADFYFNPNTTEASENVCTAKAMYQTVPLHATGASVNVMNNVLARTLTANQDLVIKAVNHPLPKSALENVLQNFATNATNAAAFSNIDSDINYGLLWSMGIFLIVCSFVVFPIEERNCGSKQLQLMTGMKAATYWLGHMMGDYIMMILAIIIAVGLFAGIDASGVFLVHGGSAIGALVVLLLMYGFAAMPFAYFHSFWFSSPGTGFAVHIMDNLLFGSIASVIVVLLELADTEDLVLGAQILKWICRFLPPFPFSHGVFLVVERAYQNNKCAFLSDQLKEEVCVLGSFLPDSVGECCPKCGQGSMAPCYQPSSFFTWEEPGIGVDLMMVFVSGVLFYAIVLLLETGWHKRILASFYKAGPGFNQKQLDPDVQNENARVQALINRGDWKQEALVVSGLKKVFKELVAVDDLSLGVRVGECFGLLGVNGAGKTTTFRMLTGDEVKTSGTAKLMGYDLDTEKALFLKRTGYCPQFDGLVDVMTGEEMLYMYARLRGFPEERIAVHVRELIDMLGLQNYWAKRCGNYSGGNKRKLSTAMAMAAEPSVLFLDEPTSGVDPVSRRRIWKALTVAINKGQSIVLTSHSMEECEALCNRLGIMVNGKFRCLGPVQHLKQKFCQGYSIQIKLNPKNHLEGQFQQLRNYIEQSIPSSTVTDMHEGLLQYYISNPSTTWQLIFSTMEGAKTTWPTFIEDYAVGETTLEQIFLAFARDQVPDKSRYNTQSCWNCCAKQPKIEDDFESSFRSSSFKG